MPRKNDPQAVKDALQAKDIEILQTSITNLTTAIDNGFKGVHERQDTTNGKVIRANEDITKLTTKFEYNRIIWYLLTVSISLLIAMASYILFHAPLTIH